MSLGLVLCLLLVCSFAPGFFFVRRLRWSPLEKLCGAVGLSLILLWLAAWGIYCFRPPGGATAYWAVSGLALGLGIAARSDIKRLVLNPAARRALLGFAFLAGWTLLILSMIRCYSGAGWGGDWTEHFQRSLFLLQRFPLDTPLWGAYQFPARPPMMNMLAAFFMAQAGDEFYIFQAAFSFLNLLMFLPCCLILPALLGRRGARAGPGGKPFLVLTALFAMNPVVMQSCTYAWTKALTAFFVILALAFYLAGWRKGDWRRTAFAFAFLAAAALVHYSAGPYCVAVGIHYLATFRRRPRKWLELAVIAAALALIAGSWFGWSLASYGAKTTFGSNTAITSVNQYHGSNFVKIALNLFDSTVPRLFREPSAMHDFDQPNPAGFLRDTAFLFYQVNIVFAMGLAGGPITIWLLFRFLRRPPDVKGRRRAAPELWFWRLLVPFSVIAGIAVVGERDPWGSAHLTLLPMAVLGLTLIAAAFPLRRVAALALLAGCAVDFSTGVLVHAHIQSLENSAARKYFTVGIDPVSGQPGPLDPLPPGSPSVATAASWYAKHQYEVNARWLRDFSLATPRTAEEARAKAQVLSLVQWTMAQDEKYWRGWVSRHNYSFRFIGDLAVEDAGVPPEVPGFVLLALFCGLMWRLGRLSLFPPPAFAAAKAARKSPRRGAQRAR